MQRSFKGFQVQRQIGAGGMSTVFAGYHSTLGYPVAIKVLHPAMSGDGRFIERFEREARLASSLQSNNVVRVIDSGEEEGVYYIVMDYIDGEDLAKVLAKVQASGSSLCKFPAEISLLLLEEIAIGLRKAHAGNIIHRDIKPSNVLLSYDGEVKIADFGLARDVRKLAQGLTMTGAVLGTPSYMSPEQAAGEAIIDHRTDVFSLGVMAYEFLSGQKPFQGKTITEVQQAIISACPPRISSDHCPWWTPQIGLLVDSMLAKDPARRPQDMEHVLKGIGDCLESIDPEGRVFRSRHDLLRGFARAPVEFSENLRREGAKSHVHKGRRFQSMGEERYADAVHEFAYALALDPGNRIAEKALKEVRRSGVRSGRNEQPGEALFATRRIPDPDEAKASDADGSPSTFAESELNGEEEAWLPSPQDERVNAARWRWGVWAGSGAIVLLAVSWLLFWPWPTPEPGIEGLAELPGQHAARGQNPAVPDGGGAQDDRGNAVREREASVTPDAEVGTPTTDNQQDRQYSQVQSFPDSRTLSRPDGTESSPLTRGLAGQGTHDISRSQAPGPGHSGRDVQGVMDTVERESALSGLGTVERTIHLDRGLRIAALTKEERDRWGIPSRIAGVLVAALDTGSPLNVAGLREGDVIMKIDHTTITDGNSFDRSVRLIDATAASINVDFWDTYRRCESRKRVWLAIQAQ